MGSNNLAIKNKNWTEEADKKRKALLKELRAQLERGWRSSWYQ
jgi:hypothetical protein